MIAAKVVLIAGLSVSVFLAGVILNQHFTIGDLEDEVTRLQVFEFADTANQTAIQDCKNKAAENIRVAKLKKAQAEAAAVRNEKRVGELERELAIVYESTRGVAGRVQGDCSAASDPEFISFMCSGPLGCKDT